VLAGREELVPGATQRRGIHRGVQANG
jgi:hypothetical protein